MSAGGANGARVVVLRDCLGGDRVVELELHRPLRADDVDRVEGARERRVLSHLPRPFVRVDVPGSFLLTGIVGERRLRFTFRLAARGDARERALAVAEALGA